MRNLDKWQGLALILMILLVPLGLFMFFGAGWPFLMVLAIILAIEEARYFFECRKRWPMRDPGKMSAEEMLEANRRARGGSASGY